MVFQKGRPRPPLRVKTCIICRGSFQPLSGAQKLCGEPECKAKARAQNLATRRKGRVDVKEEVARVLDGNGLGEANAFGRGGSGPAVVAAKRRKRNGGNGDECMFRAKLNAFSDPK